MDVRLYVANMPPEMTEQELLTLFSEAGSVTLVEMLIDQKTGKPRGFGFITMHSQEEAENAVTLFNGKDVNGHILRVNITLPREEKSAHSPSARPDAP